MAKDWVGGSAAVFKTLGASNHANGERQHEDYYATEPKATEWLCRLEQFDGRILEPACGEGHISEVLKAAGYEVVSRDLVDRGYGEVADFLAIDNLAWGGNIVTNPPYKYAQAVVPYGKSHTMQSTLPSGILFIPSRQSSLYILFSSIMLCYFANLSVKPFHSCLPLIPFLPHEP
jgi:hypothetical protein